MLYRNNILLLDSFIKELKDTMLKFHTNLLEWINNLCFVLLSARKFPEMNIPLD